VTASELKRLLKKHGCSFNEGTRHTLVRLGVRKTWMPRHPSQQIKTKTLHTILRELGIKE
jgi:mRNA interferase HicA